MTEFPPNVAFEGTVPPEAARCAYYPYCFCGKAPRAFCGLRHWRTGVCNGVLLKGNNKKQPRNGR